MQSQRQGDVATAGSARIPLSAFRRRRPRVAEQNEIQPATSGSDVAAFAASTSVSEGVAMIPELIDRLRSDDREILTEALRQMISTTKEPNEGSATEYVGNGALPALLSIVSMRDMDLQIRLQSAAAICNLSRATHALRSFSTCHAVSLLTTRVIGDDQALTGAVALMFTTMLTSESLVHSMVRHNAPILLLRGLMLCTNMDISDTICDTLIQMTTIKEIKDYMIEHRVVESCVYYLHVLARSHYLTSIRHSVEFHINQGETFQPSFINKSVREHLVWSLMQPEEPQTYSSNPCQPMPSMEVYDRERPEKRNWEEMLKRSPIIGTDDTESDFTEDDGSRAALIMELLMCLTDNSPFACGRLAGMQFSLEILTYWIRRGNRLIKQGGLLATCYLLRNGYRGFLTLKDVIEAIIGILCEADQADSRIDFNRYRCVAAEVVNDLCVFGGDNVRLTIAREGVLRPFLVLLEINDYQLHHLTMRALHTVCSHPVALAEIVSYGAIPFLCRFLDAGLKDAHAKPQPTRCAARVTRGCLSRKRVATFSMTQAEIEHSQQQQQEYGRIRRLEYCAALLRCIAAVQSPEWLHDFNKSKIVIITLDALVQNYSRVLRRQALGILASIVTVRDTNLMTSICLEGGCDWLLNLKVFMERSEDEDAPYWLAWINFDLYYLAQSSKTRKFVEQAMVKGYGDSIDISENNLLERLMPDPEHLNLEWISSLT